MQLWTYHPSGFQLGASDLKVDPKLGEYWNTQQPDFRYQEVLPLLQKLVGTDQFLWCCTLPGQFLRATEAHDLVEWELDVPATQIRAFVRASVWEDIVWGRGGDWGRLVISDPPTAGDVDVHALVATPVLPQWVKGHAPLRPSISKEVQERAERILRTPPDPDIASEYDW